MNNKNLILKLLKRWANEEFAGYRLNKNPTVTIINMSEYEGVVYGWFVVKNGSEYYDHHQEFKAYDTDYGGFVVKWDDVEIWAK